MKCDCRFRYLEPTFFAGLLDDPLLLVNIRPLGRALLFDCGQLHHLAKRVLRSINTIFISHAHMDHFMGMDTYIRHNHVSPKKIDIFGPPGLATRLEHKLLSYDWNLAEPSWCTFRAHEVIAEGLETAIFAGGEGFRRQQGGTSELADHTIYMDQWLKVQALQCDHKIPSLMFRLTEREGFSIDEQKLAAAGLVKGDWLRHLKKAFHAGHQGYQPLSVLRRQNGEIGAEEVTDIQSLYAMIHKKQTPASIGYVTDLGFTVANLARLEQFLSGVTLLVCECSFLAEDRDKARASHHLCTADVNQIIDRLRPRYFLPMHLSKSYLERSQVVYRQLVPPADVRVLRVVDRVTPRPWITAEIPKPEVVQDNQG